MLGRVVSYIIVFALGGALAGAGVLYVADSKTDRLAEWRAEEGLSVAAAAVEGRMKVLHTDLASCQRGFCAAVAADRSFSVKLFVEQDTAAPEVSGIAALYRDAMDFDLLSIVDASGRVLSSAQNPQSAGTVLATLPASTDHRPLRDRLDDKEVLTLQARIPFSCGGVELSAVGGIVLDRAFFASLAPDAAHPVIIRNGDELFGMHDVKTISTVTDGTIYINNEPWLAKSIDPGFGPGYEAWVLARLPGPLDISKLF